MLTYDLDDVDVLPRRARRACATLSPPFYAWLLIHDCTIVIFPCISCADSKGPAGKQRCYSAFC